MPRTERTEQGEQYVLPGAERRTLPGLPYAAEPDGQLALPFYEPPGADELVDSPAPARVRTAPTPAPGADSGLFGTGLAYFPQVFDADTENDGDGVP
ncbi:hypothetical protein [Azospirillum sp.]|uniref:hypothetical protein n=1 Tax=Azospirillum sp. TaxID=34012 RepID=UPI003D72F05E